MKYKLYLLCLLFFLPANKFFAQETSIWKAFNISTGNCSTNLKLYKDNSYFFETGCEQRSNINLGKWEKNGKVVRLIPEKNPDVLQISKKPYKYKNSGKIIVIDQNREPISGFEFIGFDTRIPIDDVTKEAEQKVNSVGELGLSEIYSAIDTYDGSTGDIKVHEGQVLFLFDLYQLTGEKILLAPEDLNGKHLTLKLEFPAAAFNYPALSWYELPSEYIRMEGDNFFFIEN